MKSRRNIVRCKEGLQVEFGREREAYARHEERKGVPRSMEGSAKNGAWSHAWLGRQSLRECK